MTAIITLLIFFVYTHYIGVIVLLLAGEFESKNKLLMSLIPLYLPIKWMVVIMKEEYNKLD